MNCACPDLCGGCPAMGIPTAIPSDSPATQTIHRAGVAQQSGVRASPLQGPVRRRGLASIRNATSTALRAASHLAPTQGFHARGRCLEIMTGLGRKSTQ